MSNVLTIPAAAEKYNVELKRLRGAVWQENQTGRLDLPIGDSKADTVQDDGFLQRWVDKQRSLGVRCPPLHHCPRPVDM